VSPSCVCTGLTGNSCSLDTLRLEVYPGERNTHELQEYGDKTVDIWQGRLLVFVDNSPRYEFTIFGGPPETVRPTGDRAAHRTIHGCYTLDAPEAVVAGDWDDAIVPTGAFLKHNGNTITATYVDKHGQRKLVHLGRSPWFRRRLRERSTAHHRTQEEEEPIFIGDLMSQYADCWEGDPRFTADPEHIVTPKYAHNPFGPWSFRMIRVRDGWSKQHLHTTAYSFGEYLRMRRDPAWQKQPLWSSLGMSHGCIHIDWPDLKKLIAEGWARKGRVMLVHRYGRQGPTVAVPPGSVTR
jgi:hypothetical protein